mmetsp:Transcript_23481/g.42358  ORF Transcript_23481/g.42358 Transcript_23481/m.42358 type:complete len:451 (+) Transcript_23481:97-1449(+)|eukprot:CAMPEP_0197652090 /NCGR_PEP_ID=MMETSP1338-20131121/34235_1 /TAXON_ID=43686 ORGANISM="Pelagodinium beii, Strain RCC1491" /NCGR_SAMPLE_ID=MMETSP1338 /ASSEMBLY_ACC=CAM_ASM_000754 /LENGTH=450 /DNA_ID=CAMNT_0043226889 /DNA_START=90 /DNA_END=1442 /DNA_ORIENTATION=+
MKLFLCAATLGASLAWKMDRPAASLLEEISAAEDAEGSSDEKVATDCHAVTCPEDYVLNGAAKPAVPNADTCCLKTCATWECDESKGFSKNEAYKGNIGESDEQCCDSLCMRATCPANFKIPTDRMKIVGIEHRDCCAQTCVLTTCIAPKVKSLQKASWVGHTQDVCCDDTCASFECPAGTMLNPDWLTEVADNAVKRVDKESCCVDTCIKKKDECATVEKEVPPSRYSLMVKPGATITEIDETCCRETCQSHTCNEEAGWHKNVGPKLHCLTNPCTDSQCCMPACKNFECPDGWVADDTKAHEIPTDKETCCKRTCKVMEKCAAGFVPGSFHNHNDTVGQTSEICCDTWCSNHTCAVPGTILVPSKDEKVGNTDDACCEDQRCPRFRNMTESKTPGCNGLSKEECVEAYTTLRNHQRDGESYDKMTCDWDETFSICRVGSETQPMTCDK